MSRWLLVLAGCGRIGFDAHFDATGGTGSAGVVSDAPRDVSEACSSTGPTCPSDEYCTTPIGQCTAPGTCQPIPTMPGGDCLDVTVCGCDGMIYATECAAATAGVSISSVGSTCAT